MDKHGALAILYYMRNIYRKLLVLMVAVVAALPACADDGQTFYGFQIDELLKSDDHSYKFGFVKFNTSDTTNVEIVKDAGGVYSPLMSAGEYFDGKIYCYMFKWDEFFEEQYAYSYDVYDAKTFERLSRVSKSYGRRVLDMTYDHTTNTMYAIAEDEDGRTNTETGATSLYIVDMSNGNLTRVGSAGNLVGINGYGKRVSDNLVNIAADKDGNLYAIYGTPAESLCATQAKQYDEWCSKIGVTNVFKTTAHYSPDYFTNSFHVNVTEEITPFEKQDAEFDDFHLCEGGHIQYVRLDSPKNEEALSAVIRRGMALGFYQGVNFDSAYCNECGRHSTNVLNKCPYCGSTNISVISRVCGYLGYSNVNGHTRMNDGKMAEIRNRVSM